MGYSLAGMEKRLQTEYDKLDAAIDEIQSKISDEESKDKPKESKIEKLQTLETLLDNLRQNIQDALDTVQGRD